MTRGEARALLAIILALAVSGFALAISKRLLAQDDPFAAIGSPWEPWFHKLHVLAAPLFLFLFGGVYRRHVQIKLRDQASRGRRSGTSTLWLVLLLAGSGYLFEVLTAETWRNAVSLAHLGAGIVFVVAYTLHARNGPAAISSETGVAARRPVSHTPAFRAGHDRRPS